MTYSFHKLKGNILYRLFIVFLSFSFSINPIVPMGSVYAQEFFSLPAPGTMVLPTPNFLPPLIKGITIHPENPLQFDFIIHNGDTNIEGDELEIESIKQIKYFLASLTVPESDMWVNLSPYEKDRIIPEAFGVTEMGRDLLMQDYILKQLTASLIYPEDELGKQFWERTYQKAYELYGTTDIPINTFNKIWIVPQKAVVYERGNTVFVLESHLKVMLEGDYKALRQNLYAEELGTDQLADTQIEELSEVSEQVVREVLLPEIEREVNQGENFTELRQIYNAMILAAWYKTKLYQGLLGQIYIDQNKTAGVDVTDKEVKLKIYDQYLQAFKAGVYNFIKDEYDPEAQEVVSRTYFSGGFDNAMLSRNILDAIDGNSREARADLALLDAAASRGDVHRVEVSVAESPDFAMTVGRSPEAIIPKTVTSIVRSQGQASSLAVSDLKNEYYIDERISFVSGNVNYNGHLMVVLQGSESGQSARRASELLASQPFEGARGELGELFRNAIENNRGNIKDAITQALGWLKTRLVGEGLQEPLDLTIVYEEQGLRLAVTKTYVAALSARLPVIIANEKGETLFNARENYQGNPQREGNLMDDNYQTTLQITEVDMGPGHITILGSEGLTNPGERDNLSEGRIERDLVVLVRMGGQKAEDLVNFAVEKRGVDTSERGVVAMVQRQTDVAMTADEALPVARTFILELIQNGYFTDQELVEFEQDEEGNTQILTDVLMLFQEARSQDTLVLGVIFAEKGMFTDEETLRGLDDLKTDHAGAFAIGLASLFNGKNQARIDRAMVVLPEHPGIPLSLVTVNELREQMLDAPLEEAENYREYLRRRLVAISEEEGELTGSDQSGEKAAERQNLSLERGIVNELLEAAETRINFLNDPAGNVMALLSEEEDIIAERRPDLDRESTTASDRPTTPGGIDLAPGFLNLQIKRDDNGIPLPIEAQDLPSIQIEGLYPVIINITPVTSLPLLLGELETEETIASSI